MLRNWATLIGMQGGYWYGGGIRISGSGSSRGVRGGEANSDGVVWEYWDDGGIRISASSSFRV